jgi:hypothetical protein
MFYGTEDEHLNEERLKYEKQLFRELFGDSANIIAFEGKHELKKECLATLIE